jgi:uncharacterized protein with PQ loop repeat
VCNAESTYAQQFLLSRYTQIDGITLSMLNIDGITLSMFNIDGITLSMLNIDGITLSMLNLCIIINHTTVPADALNY